ncbi:GDSL esterase/lipase At2g40250-like [Salvia splendens]|uniref:GDSL esterase/lipase At2g40250-like n=1 Tax=Salvia splendens TaxID=180675 RepID=UPI001C25DA54|nr:GDSL esterase/lipase At2g40250-like [Salvia splendens]
MNYTTHLLFILISITSLLRSTAAEPLSTTAVYAFGDAIFDTGNNNGLRTICRADHPPYAAELHDTISFGRFSNGMLPADILVHDLGLKPLMQPYLNMQTAPRDTLRTGVSFASTCSGLDDLTADEVGVLTMTAQYRNFEAARETMRLDIGDGPTDDVLKNAVYLISGGTNDMLVNYYAIPIRRLTYSVSAYHEFLLGNLKDFVKKLYKRGARRVGVLGMPPVGCLPLDISTKFGFKRECVSQHNADATQFNERLQQYINQFVTEMPQLKIAYIDIYNPMMDMINNPSRYGQPILPFLTN